MCIYKCIYAHVRMYAHVYEPSTARYCVRTHVCATPHAHQPMCTSLSRASLECASSDVYVAHARINQYRLTICVSQSVIFGSNTPSGATTSRPNGLPEKPPLTAYVYTRTKWPIGSCAALSSSILICLPAVGPSKANASSKRASTDRGCNPPDQKRVLMYAEREKLTRRPRKTQRTV